MTPQATWLNRNHTNHVSFIILRLMIWLTHEMDFGQMTSTGIPLPAHRTYTVIEVILVLLIFGKSTNQSSVITVVYEVQEHQNNPLGGLNSSTTTLSQ